MLYEGKKVQVHSSGQTHSAAPVEKQIPHSPPLTCLSEALSSPCSVLISSYLNSMLPIENFAQGAPSW